MSRSKAVLLAVVVLVVALFAWTGAAQAVAIERVSVASDGTEAIGGSGPGSLSADGRFVAFVSSASNLVAGDTNGVEDVFVRDRQTGITEIVSVATGGVQGNARSRECAISADGRYVVFTSAANNLVSGDTNNLEDIFLRDRQMATTIRVSVSNAGAQASGERGHSSDGSVSADGRYVAFVSEAANLIAGDTNGSEDIFVRDRQAGTTARANLSSSEAQANNWSRWGRISSDGRYVVFWSQANNLVSGDTNQGGDIFVRNLVAGTTERVSVSSSGAQANWPFPEGSTFISADGRYVLFTAGSGTLVSGDTNALPDAFLRDRTAGTTQRVSLGNGGNQAITGSYACSVSDDGRYAVFVTDSTTLVPGDTNGTWDVFVRDRVTGATDRISVSNSGAQGTAASNGGSISADSHFVAFVSQANNLVPGDTNAAVDAFVATLDWTPTIGGLSPVSGSVLGTNTVTISGTNFLGVTSVTFGGVPATGVTVVNPGTITAIAPAHEPGMVQVQVATGTGATPDTAADDYTYNPPTISGVVPNRGSTDGGTAVVITGTYLGGASSVTFDGAPATEYTVDSATQITATSPSHGVGAVQIQVTVGGSSTPDTSADDYTYCLPPTVSGIAPSIGPVTGGASVTITGTEFTGVTGPGGVTFGGKNALSYTVDTPTQITAIAPYHAAGVVQVRVTNNGVSSQDVPADDFTYLADPSGPLQAHERVSLDSAEAQGNLGSGSSSASGDGRYVAFASSAGNLVPADTNGVLEVFVRDRETGTTERVSVATDGTQANDESGAPCISADGRFVAFWSDATNLVARDTNGLTDIFVYDRETGATERVSVTAGGAQATGGGCSWAAINADGRYVAFSSAATNLVAGDTNGSRDIFVHDCESGATERVSVDSAEGQAGNESDFVSISGDGRYVAFDSVANGLVSADYNGVWDVFVRDRTAGTTQRVSVAGAATEGNDVSGYPHISADGRYVAFESYATNLVTGDSNGVVDVFVRDRTAGATSRVSVTSAGIQANGSSETASVSGDGQYVAFYSDATNLVSGDTNGVLDVFVRDRLGGTTRRVSVDASGWQGNGDSGIPSLSADGKFVTFTSRATNLVPGDTNSCDDVFAFATPCIPSYPSYRGSDRYDTALKLSKAMFPGALPADSGLVLAPGETFPEALCGAPLAVAYGGPVLLTPSAGLNNGVKAEILRLAPKYVFCIGLSPTVVSAVLTAMGPSVTVVPINGTDPYVMSHNVAHALAAKVGSGGLHAGRHGGHHHPRGQFPRCHRSLAPGLRQALAHHPYQLRGDGHARCRHRYHHRTGHHSDHQGGHLR